MLEDKSQPQCLFDTLHAGVCITLWDHVLVSRWWAEMTVWTFFFLQNSHRKRKEKTNKLTLVVRRLVVCLPDHTLAVCYKIWPCFFPFSLLFLPFWPLLSFSLMPSPLSDTFLPFLSASVNSLPLYIVYHFTLVPFSDFGMWLSLLTTVP